MVRVGLRAHKPQLPSQVAEQKKHMMQDVNEKFYNNFINILRRSNTANVKQAESLKKIRESLAGNLQNSLTSCLRESLKTTHNVEDAQSA